MKKLFTVTKYELLRYFISPLAYVYLIAFLVLNSSFAIYFGHFFERGRADLLQMFFYQPWLYLLFVSGIAMRLWAEEFKSKTIIQIASMPVPITTLVLGKFFASWLFCTIALLLTFPFVITVNWLGEPDNGVIVLGYLGSIILAGCMLSVSQAMSACTKNQVIALVLSVALNLVFFLSGLEYVLAMFRLFSPMWFVDLIASFSFLTHFETMVQGILELRDLVFFASVIILFNLITILVVSFRTSGTSQIIKSSKKGSYGIVFLMLFLGFVGINITSNVVLRNFRYDFTADKTFTLSKASVEILQGLKERVTAKLYYSKELEEKNSDIRQVFDRLCLLLSDFQRVSKGRFSYKIYHPKTLDNVEDEAYAYNLQPIPLIASGQNLFFGMVIKDEIDNSAIIPFFAPGKGGLFEEDIIAKIYMLDKKKKVLGMVLDLAIFNEGVEAGMVMPEWEVVSQIEKFYDIKIIKKSDDFEGIDVLMIVHPYKLSKDIKKGIINYTQEGGKILTLLDVASEAPRIYSMVNQEFVPSSIRDFEKIWGFRFYDNLVVGDLDNSIMVDATNDYAKNPVFTQDVLQFILTENNFNQNAIETKYLREVLFASASVLQQISNDIVFVPLIEAGSNSELISRDVVYEHMHPADILRIFRKDDYPKVIAAKIVSKNPDMPFEMIAVADTDFMYDTFWMRQSSVLEEKYAVAVFDNVNFVLNALDTLSRDTALIELRGKRLNPRNFTKIENLRKQNSYEFRLKETEIFSKIDAAKMTLKEVLGKRNFEERADFNPDELAVITGIRDKLNDLRLELSNIKVKQDANIERIDFYVKLFNIYAVVLLITSYFLGVFIFRKRKRTSAFAFDFNKRMALVSLGAGLLFGTGLLANYFNNRLYLDEYIGKKAFPSILANLNEIDSLSFKNSLNQLDFYKKEGIWYLKQKPDLPVYQERISRFLTALSNATYYEKKTDKAEYLAKFGLAPMSVSGSNMVNVKIAGLGKTLLSIDIGKQDVDLGRGSKASYIKFSDEFQVWLIDVDFVDLSLKAEDFTYSFVWNLRFGRMEGKTAELVKELMNTKLLEPVPLPDVKPYFVLDVKTEHGDEVKMKFFEEKGKFYMEYVFPEDIKEPRLRFFAKSIKDKVFEISKRVVDVAK